MQRRRSAITKLLLRLFVRDYQQTENPRVRTACGFLSGVVCLICNLLLFAGKLLVGTLSGSVSITADAINNLSDASSSVVTLVGFKIAGKPADAGHPYGHARVEYLSGLAVAALILLIGVELAKSSVDKILHPAPVEFSAAVVVVLVLSILVKLWMALFNRTLGRRIGSPALEATAADSRNDVISTAAVLVAAVVGALTKWNIDGYMGLLVALFIMWSGVGIARDTIDPLLGQQADPKLRQIIAKEIFQSDKVLGFHDLMVHDYGPGQRFATVHVEMDMREDPMVCHDIIDDIERDCMARHNIHLSIHYDPIVTDDEELNHMKALISELVQGIDQRLSIHDFRMVRGPTHTNLIFDMIIPYEMQSRRLELKQRVDEAVRRESDHYFTVITFDEEAFNRPEKRPKS